LREVKAPDELVSSEPKVGGLHAGFFTFPTVRRRRPPDGGVRGRD